MFSLPPLSRTVIPTTIDDHDSLRSTRQSSDQFTRSIASEYGLGGLAHTLNASYGQRVNRMPLWHIHERV